MLPVGSELRVSGRLRASGPVTFTLKGRQGGKPVALTARIEGTAEVKRPWVARQWASARIEDILRSSAHAELDKLASAVDPTLIERITTELATPWDGITREAKKVDADEKDVFNPWEQ